MSTESNDLNHLAVALAGLSPVTSRLDRDGLLHAAGRMDGERRALPWKRATFGLAGIALALVAWTALRGPRIEHRTVVVSVPAVDPGPSASEYARLASSSFSAREADRSVSSVLPADRAQLEARWRVLRFGADALPDGVSQVNTGTGPPERPIERDLGMPRDSFKGLSDRRLNATAGPWRVEDLNR